LRRESPPSGTFALYSAGRGEAALDRLSDDDRNPNSVFTRVLLPALARSDLDLPALAVEVREEVTRLTQTVNHAQRPAYYDETSGGRIFLARRPAGSSRPATPVPPPRPAGAAPAGPQQTAVVAHPVGGRPPGENRYCPTSDPCAAPPCHL
jgi:hypothetical protein